MISIFTPAYNRKKELKRLYESLESQTDKRFKWLIIDDGSTDNTKDYINEIIKKSTFKINYYYKENGGKPSAHNFAINICETKYMLIVDSDDYLTSNAIEILNMKICQIDKNEKISGIIGMRGKISKTGQIKPLSTRIPNVKYSTGLELYQKLGFEGDTLRLYKTKILKKYLFPIISNEKFISENVVFDKIDTKYKMLVIEEILYLCEYQDDGLTRNINNIRIKNPIGYALSLKSTAETALTLKKKVGVTCLYIMWCKKFKIKSFINYKNKILYLMCYLLAICLMIIKKPKFYYDMFEVMK